MRGLSYDGEGDKGFPGAEIGKRVLAAVCHVEDMDYLRESTASACVSPWPFSSGYSGENATNHFFSRTLRA